MSLRVQRIKGQVVNFTLPFVLATLLFPRCAYFNTFYNAQAFFREGMRLKEQSQIGQAKPKFEKAIEKSAIVISRWPKSRWIDDALFLIGRSYYEEGEFSRAASSFGQLELVFPKARFIPEAKLYRGLALLKDGKTGTARVVLEELKGSYPRLRDVVEYHLALTAIEQGEEQKGIDSLLAFVNRYPKSRYYKEAVKQLAEGFSRLKNYDSAERWFWRYLQIESRARVRAEVQMKIAQLRLEQGKFTEGVAMAQEVLGRYADLEEELSLLLGKGYAGMGKHEEALTAFNRVRSATARGAEAAFHIGRFYESNKDFIRAKAYYDTARLRRTESEHGIYALKRLGLLQAIVEDTLKKRTPAEAIFLLAEVHNLNLGEYDDALELYQKVYDSFPESDWAPKALFAQAWIYQRIKKDSLAAAEIMKKIISEYPKTEYAEESRKRFGLIPKVK